MRSITQRIATFTHNLNYTDLPIDAIEQAKRFLLDSLGCAFAATARDDMKSMLRFTEKLGGVPEATVIGYGLRTNAPNAGLMNGLLIRALDFNDIYWVQDPSHPSDLLGIVLAAAEANSRDGREAILATILAYELEMRWCHAAHPGIREVGWHHASLTQFVSPFVAGRLYGLDEEQLAAAAGLSGSSHFTLGGVVAGHLTNMKNAADPLAAQAGLLATLMAREGITGPEQVVEGKEGLIEVLADVEWDLEAVVDGLGEKYMITNCSYKAFPTEALTHQPISAALSLREEYGLEPERIASVSIDTTTRGADILSDPSKYKPDTPETADHSLPYVVAVALVKGYVLPSSFEEGSLWDPDVRELLTKIKVKADPAIDALFPHMKRARVVITTYDGGTYERQTDIAKGDPQDPLSDQELFHKFKENAGHVFREARIQEIIDTTLSLESCEDMRKFVEGLIPA